VREKRDPITGFKDKLLQHKLVTEDQLAVSSSRVSYVLLTYSFGCIAIYTLWC
jgi:TPP-dependent pyruvate/acetoin dehydrogenase alpha subunit